MTCKVFRPQDFVIAVLFIVAMIGPAVLGLACHLAWLAAKLTWGLAHG